MKKYFVIFLIFISYVSIVSSSDDGASADRLSIEKAEELDSLVADAVDAKVVGLVDKLTFLEDQNSACATMHQKHMSCVQFLYASNQNLWQLVHQQGAEISELRKQLAMLQSKVEGDYRPLRAEDDVLGILDSIWGKK